MNSKKILSLLLALCMVLTFVPLTARADGQVYYNIDYSKAVAASRVCQQVTGDCALASMATVECYLYGITDSSTMLEVYNQIYKANSYSLRANWTTLGYAEAVTYSLQKLYDALAQGNPVLIQRRYWDSTKSDYNYHFSVVCGYSGSTSTLEESGFIVAEVSSYSGYSGTKCLMTLTQWRQAHSGTELLNIVTRKSGQVVTNVSGIHMTINYPKSVHTTGDTHRVCGHVTSDSNLATVQLYIVDANTGEYVYNLAATPNAKSFNLMTAWNDQVKFKEMAEGEYYYVVYARDAAGNKKIEKKYFIVSTTLPDEEPEGATYTVSYSGNGGTGTDPAATTLSFYDELNLPENPYTKEGYHFVGWSVQRYADGGYPETYVSGEGWIQTVLVINPYLDYEAHIFDAGMKSYLSPGWIQGTGGADCKYTFYARWEEGCETHKWGDPEIDCDPGSDTWAKLVCVCTVCGAKKLFTFDEDIQGAPDETTTVTRLAGATRYDTAIKAADELKARLGVEKFDTIIVASGTSFADALSGSYLAAVKNAPILLANNDKQNALTAEYIKNNLAEDGTVYILGGAKAVPASMDAMLEGLNVQRLAGADRYETNMLILKEGGLKSGDEILVCTGTDFADSLSVSATGKPILLVSNNYGKLYTTQVVGLALLKNCTYTIIGGEKAVSQTLEDTISRMGTTTRVAGSNRYETSVLVAEKYFEDPWAVVLAYARNFPDGLCGGALAYAMDAPLILTMTNNETQAALYVQSQGIHTGVVMGSDELISDNSVRAIFAMDTTDEITVK